METYYLDTSAFIKRYVDEPGSSVVDELFEKAYDGAIQLAISYWNIGESAVVLDKYQRRIGIDARKVFRTMLSEIRTLTRINGLILVEISPYILRESVKQVFKHHIYVADALQIASAKKVRANYFIASDEELLRYVEAEGLKTINVLSLTHR